MNYLKSTILVLFLSLILFSCVQLEEKEVESNATPNITKMAAMLNPLGSSEVSGMVYFTQTESGVLVDAEISGLSETKHGFHIHQYGDCSAMDGTSAGGHFNPRNMEHGSPSSEPRHVGDLGNLEKSENSSTASYSYTFANMKLAEIAGRGLIVHAGEDDLMSQPTGDAGGRLACGVIGVVQN